MQPEFYDDAGVWLLVTARHVFVGEINSEVRCPGTVPLRRCAVLTFPWGSATPAELKHMTDKGPLRDSSCPFKVALMHEITVFRNDNLLFAGVLSDTARAAWKEEFDRLAKS